MSSMLTTVWLILGALSFAAIMEYAGFIDRLLQPLVTVARTDGLLIATTGLSSIGLNVIAGDQYVADVLPARAYRADVLPARAYRAEYARRGLAPRMLSRTVEDTGTVTSALVPWNSCGAYMSGVLGIPTVDYLPYAFFNLINPLLAIIFGLIGFGVEHQEPSGGPAESPAATPTQ
jgi:Na+:H+ antiporter, NhaC family